MRILAPSEMTFDVPVKRRITAHLTLMQRGAYEKLIDHYWDWGCLLPSNRELAGICGIHPKTFAKLRSGLDMLFDVDEEGQWRDRDLEERRAAAVRTKATRAEAGKAGAGSRWGKDDPVTDSERSKGAGLAIATAMANALANGTEEGVEIGSEPLATAMPVVAPPGSIDLSIYLEDSKEIDLSDLSIPLASGHGASGPMARLMANLTSDPPAAEPIALANAMAPAAAAAKPAKLEAPAAADASAARSGFSDKQVLDLVREACGENVEPGLMCFKEMKAIRTLMHSGYDLEAEILPVLRGVKHLHSKLKTLRGHWIREEMDRARQAAAEAAKQAEAAPSKGPTPHHVFVVSGTAEWRAWQDEGRRAGKRMMSPGLRREGKPGWYFPSRWPPGHEPPDEGAGSH